MTSAASAPPRRRQRDPYWAARLEVALPGVRCNSFEVRERRTFKVPGCPWTDGLPELVASVSFTAPASTLRELGVLDPDDLAAEPPCGAWRRGGADLWRTARGIRVVCCLTVPDDTLGTIAGRINGAMLALLWRPPTRHQERAR